MPERSPVIFWLLLAATICIDVIAGKLIHDIQSVEAATGMYGLVFGQLTTLSGWALFSRQSTAVRSLSIALAVCLSAIATVIVTSNLEIMPALAIYATHVTIVTSTLWLLRAASTRRESLALAQFSIMHLLILMTVVALVAALLGNAKILQGQWTFTLRFGNAVIAAACVAPWHTPRHWLIRLSGACAVAIFCGWLTSLSSPDLSGQLEVMNCLQVVVIFTWIQLGGILSEPRGESASDGPAESVGLEPAE